MISRERGVSNNSRNSSDNSEGVNALIGGRGKDCAEQFTVGTAEQ